MAENAKTPRLGILEEMTLEEVRGFGAEIVLLPIGSTEPHGPHLPYCCDTLNARCVSEGATMIANERGVKALCYPTLPISLNVNFSGFPFALSLKVRTFMAVLMDLCEQIEREGVRKIVIINGHGGNPAAIGAFLREWAQRGVAGTVGAAERAFVCGLNWPVGKAGELLEHPSDHAGEHEVLQMMAVRKDLVRKEKLGEFKSRRPGVKALERKEVMWVKPWHLHLPEGAHGETREVNQEKAQRFVQLNNQEVAEIIIELAQMPWSELFPYE